VKKVYTAAFTAQVALDLLKEEKTLAQISSEYGVHTNVLREWRTQALKGLSSVFERRDDVVLLRSRPLILNKLMNCMPRSVV
jgi:transposase-like protein